MITVILMLYNAITNLISIIGLGEDHAMISNDETKDQMEEDK